MTPLMLLVVMIFRFGTGNDSHSWAGDDTVYFTVDQLQGTSTNTITDSIEGDDKIQIDEDLEGRIGITGKVLIRLSLLFLFRDRHHNS